MVELSDSFKQLDTVGKLRYEEKLGMLGVTTRAAAIYLIYRDMRYIAILFSHIAIQTCMEYTEIDGRIDGERRKYTKSHSAAATSVGPHTYIRIPLRCCVHVHRYCKLSSPIEIKISRPCKYLNV